MWLLALFLAGCASLSATNGPVTVVLGDQISITKSCEQAGAYNARGCVKKWGNTYSVYCTFSDVECLAHEIRHILDWDFHSWSFK